MQSSSLKEPTLYAGGADPGSDDSEYNGNRSVEPLAVQALYPVSLLVCRMLCGELFVSLHCFVPRRHLPSPTLLEHNRTS